MAMVYLAVETESMLEMMRDFLGAYGHVVVGGTRGLSAALEAVPSHLPSLDAVILDLPAKPEGLLRAVQQLRQVGPGLRIVVVSEQFQLAPMLLAAGADRFVERPFQLEALIRALPQGVPPAKQTSQNRERSLGERSPLKAESL